MTHFTRSNDVHQIRLLKRSFSNIKKFHQSIAFTYFFGLKNVLFFLYLNSYGFKLLQMFETMLLNL